MDVEYLRRMAAPRLAKFYPKKVDLDFSGSSPPELFVGDAFYPKVNAGILAPTNYDEESFKLTNPEQWFKENLKIEDILALRSSLIYSRFKIEVKARNNRLLDVMQEVSMAEKPTSVGFNLKKKPRFSMNFDVRSPPIGNPAPLVKARLEENPKVHKKVEYFVSDYDLKSTDAIQDLYKSSLTVTNIVKLLSAGLLGVKSQRRLTPSKWSITAVDSLVSKNLMKEVRNFSWINEFQVFHDEYLGNHYEILLMPRQWSFEVIEAAIPSEIHPKGGFWHDHEGYWDRKKYASSVVGAYYANRLAVCEYLMKIKRQASALIFREVKPSYWAPCGVGILREVTRNAFTKKPEKFENIKSALECIGKRLQLGGSYFSEKSFLLKEKKEQKNLTEYT